MFRGTLMGAAVAAALGLPCVSHAADDAELARIRGEILEMKQQYEARIRALERRLEQAQGAGAPAAATATASTAAGTQAPPNADGRPSASLAASAAGAVPVPPRAAPAAGRFNPDISVILSGQYVRTSQDPETYAMTGFRLPEGVEAGPGERGLGLGETEIGITANIDPYLRGALRVALEPGGEVAIEEANIQTTGLSRGLTLKAGRFFSGVGYLNEQHPHYWDFVDAPLAYQAFLGRQYGDDGLQVRWLAPTDTFLEFGAEIGRARAFPGTGGGRGNGIGSHALFAHTGGDVGDSHSWRAGLSLLQVNSRDLQTGGIDASGGEVPGAFTGRNRFWIADFVWRWAPGGNQKQRNFKLQGEYIRRAQDGELAYGDEAASGPDAFRSRQSGWYLQAVYQFMPRWRVGLRTDRLSAGVVDHGLNSASLVTPAYDPRRNTLMLDYSPSEYSRVRLQFARDESRQGQPDHQLFLQYQMSLGAHGAHRF